LTLGTGLETLFRRGPGVLVRAEQPPTIADRSPGILADFERARPLREGGRRKHRNEWRERSDRNE
jgi:hypothetical protein